MRSRHDVHFASLCFGYFVTGGWAFGFRWPGHERKNGVLAYDKTVFCSDDRKSSMLQHAHHTACLVLSSCQVFRPQSFTVFHRSIIPKLGGWGILNLLRYANVDNVVGFSKPLKATSILQMNWTGRALDGPARRSTASSRSLTFQSRYAKQSLMG